MGQLDQGAAILDALLQDLGRMQGVVAGMYAPELSEERLAALPATRLPMALVSASLPQPVGSWKASSGLKTLWEMRVAAAVALPVPAAATALEARQTLQSWAQRLQSRLEGDSEWATLAANVAAAGPPDLLRNALAAAVTRELVIQYVMDA